MITCCAEDKIGIAISFCLSFAIVHNFFEYEFVAGILQGCIKRGVFGHESDKKQSFGYIELLTDPGAEFSIIKFPLAYFHTFVQISSIDVCNCLLWFFRHSLNDIPKMKESYL